MFLFPWFFFFAEELEGSKRGCWPVKCMSVFTSTLLSGQRTFAWVKKTGTYPALCGSLLLLPRWYMPEEMGALVLSCRCFFFFPDPSPLHCTEDFLFVGLLRRDTPTSPRLKAWDIQNKEKIGFYRTSANELFPVQRHQSVWSVWNSTNKERKRV